MKNKKIIIYIIIVFMFIFNYMYTIFPNLTRKNEVEKFENYQYAHRGLYNDEIPENSMKAFELALENGYGIEFDVQSTLDNQLVVCHDQNLMRMCGKDILIEENTYETIKDFTLLESEEHIPLFKDVLDLVNGQVPIIVEIKYNTNWENTAKLVAEMLDTYNGDYFIQSFHHKTLKWFRKNRPNVIRGQLSADFFEYYEIKGQLYKKFIFSNLMRNYISRPDIIIYEYQHRYQPSFLLLKNVLHCKTGYYVLDIDNNIKTNIKIVH